jgi:hypothetical protein
MPQADTTARRFSVHARHVDKHHSRVVVEDSFEAAAVSYIEHFSPVMSLEDEPPNISLIVRDLGTGQEHCFTVNLESGETSYCE